MWDPNVCRSIVKRTPPPLRKKQPGLGCFCVRERGRRSEGIGAHNLQLTAWCFDPSSEQNALYDRYGSWRRATSDHQPSSDGRGHGVAITSMRSASCGRSAIGKGEVFDIAHGGWFGTEQ